MPELTRHLFCRHSNLIYFLPFSFPFQHHSGDLLHAHYLKNPYISQARSEKWLETPGHQWVKHVLFQRIANVIWKKRK